MDQEEDDLETIIQKGQLARAKKIDELVAALIRACPDQQEDLQLLHQEIRNLRADATMYLYQREQANKHSRRLEEERESSRTAEMEAISRMHRAIAARTRTQQTLQALIHEVSTWPSKPVDAVLPKE